MRAIAIGAASAAFLMPATATSLPADSILRLTPWVESPSRPGIFVARFRNVSNDWSEGAWNSFAVTHLGGGSVACFETQDEELLLGSILLGSGPSNPAWVGLRRADDSSPWIWETGIPLSYGLGIKSVDSGDQTVLGYLENGGIRTYEAWPSGLKIRDSLLETSFLDCDGNGEHDSFEIWNSPWLDWDSDGNLDICEEQGIVYCGSGNPNSTGNFGGIRALGRTQIVANDLILYATALPPGKFGYWLASLSTENIPGFGGSLGTLCLGAPQIRFNIHPKYGVWSVPSNGRVETVLDLTDIPQVGSIKSGETWHFQAWHRDIVGGTLTSNTTDASMITFE